MVWDGVWKVVVGEGNTIVALASLDEALTYMFEWGWRVEQAAEYKSRQANS